MSSKKVICFLVVVLVFSVVMGMAYQQASVAAERNWQGLIRFHVIANSDNVQDQEVKYQVRDAVVAYLTPRLAHVGTYDEAYRIVEREKPEILALAQQVVQKAGYCYPVRVETGCFPFPIKSYGELVLPSGNYQAVRIILGSGTGRNWWCVLFPPLCFIDVATSTATGNPESDVPQLKFKIQELLARQEGNL